MKRRLLSALAIIIGVIGIGWFAFGAKEGPAPSPETLVRAQVEGFGRAQKDVSLLSPTAAADIARAYGPYASAELISRWQRDPERAPGRLTSSPWPERIDIVQAEETSPASYLVTGALALMASAGPAGTIPVTLTLSREGDAWRITGYEEPRTRPAETGRKDVALSIGESATAFGVRVTPLAVTEDSRCAKDVACIWAGTIKVSTELVSGMGTSTMNIELGKPVTTEAEEITLTAVAPEPRAGSAIPAADYRFTFRIEQRDLSY
jgi:hypothetical protein